MLALPWLKMYIFSNGFTKNAAFVEMLWFLRLIDVNILFNWMTARLPINNTSVNWVGKYRSVFSADISSIDGADGAYSTLPIFAYNWNITGHWTKWIENCWFWLGIFNFLYAGAPFPPMSKTNSSSSMTTKPQNNKKTFYFIEWLHLFTSIIITWRYIWLARVIYMLLKNTFNNNGKINEFYLRFVDYEWWGFRTNNKKKTFV